MAATVTSTVITLSHSTQTVQTMNSSFQNITSELQILTNINKEILEQLGALYTTIIRQFGEHQLAH